MLTQAFTALVLAGAVVAQQFQVTASPPSIQQCQPASFSWQGGTAPYILSAIPQGQTSAAALVTIAEGVTGTSYTWIVNLPQGTAINFKITDATGAINYSSGLTVQAGSSGCLSGASASGSSAVTSAVPASSGAASSAPAPSQTSVNSASLSSAAASRSSQQAAASSAGSMTSSTMSGSQTSRPASSGSGSAASGAASTSNAAGAKAAFNVPVLALAGAGAFVFLGGFAALA